MILEVAILNVIPGREAQFEDAFRQAQRIISSMSGYRSHEMRRCVEAANRYILLVNWDRIEDHTVGFRGSSGYQEMKRPLHPFFDPFSRGETHSTVGRGA